MGIIVWKELCFNDEIVWDTLANGEMQGVKFGRDGEDGEPDDKDVFLTYVKRIKPRSIEELMVAIALTTYHWRWINEDKTECILNAYEGKVQDGPFEQLKETYGYPIFKDQLASIMSDSFNLEMDQAYELADGMGKRLIGAKKRLYSFRRMNRKKKEFLWDVAPTVAGRRWITHYANLIYEAVWLVYNGSVRDYYLKNPIKIY